MTASFDNFNVWIERPKYDEAERAFYEQAKKASLTPLADEVAKARLRLMEVKGAIADGPLCVKPASDNSISSLQAQFDNMQKSLLNVMKKVESLEERISSVETAVKHHVQRTSSLDLKEIPRVEIHEDEDDIDLFGSESEEEGEEAAKVREERLAAYNAKKSKKPALIAKSNVILDVKPWDDETDMEVMEKKVREITADGLLWGAAKLVPLAYGIKKLQISSVVEDDKVSIDWLTEQIELLEEYVQSVDIAAFNKI